ncbi:MAG: hypothetical protein WBG44_12650 [Comamonas sp.]
MITMGESRGERGALRGGVAALAARRAARRAISQNSPEVLPREEIGNGQPCGMIAAMNTNAIQTELTRVALFELAIGLILLIALIWISYVLMKNAIRDGIRESGLIEALRRNTDRLTTETRHEPRLVQREATPKE